MINQNPILKEILIKMRVEENIKNILDFNCNSISILNFSQNIYFLLTYMQEIINFEIEIIRNVLFHISQGIKEMNHIYECNGIKLKRL